MSDQRSPSLESEHGDLSFLAGAGEMAQLMRAHDWSRTPLGPVRTWPQSLRAIVSLLLNSRYPMFLAWGPQLAFLYNDGYRPIFGEKHPRALGQPFARIWGEIWEDVRPLVDRALAGQATWSKNLPLFMQRHGFLEETYFTFSYSPVRGDDGAIAGMFCACTETTAEVLAERRLATLRDLHAGTPQANTLAEACVGVGRVLAQNQHDLPFSLLYLMDGRDCAQLAAQAGCDPEHGYSPQQLQVRPHAQDGWPRRAFVAGERRILEGLALQCRLPEKLSGEVVSTAAILPLSWRGSGRPDAMLICGANPRLAMDEQYERFLDLLASAVSSALGDAEAYETERKRAESLAELDRAKTAFFANVSHEFRTPLTLMLSPLEEALQEETSPAGRERLELALRNSQRLLKLVNSLLDFARIEAGRLRAQFEPIDLAAYTQDLASVFRSAIERAGLRFIVQCEPLHAPVSVDREMWEQIVLNLLSNALKFTHKGAITLSLKNEGECAVLEVRDTGVGVPEAELPRLFERFHRIAGVQGRTHEGAGIGLALVQELVKLHDGRIEASSLVGEGTTFSVRVPFGAHSSSEIAQLPLLTSASPAAQTFVQEALRWLPDNQTIESAPTLSGAPRALTRRFESTFGARLLLADDNADMRAYVRGLLAPYYTVQLASDGREALEACRREPPDLLITDVMMPQLDGVELVRLLRQDPRLRSTPIVMLSARAGDEARFSGFEAGADDYLVKPFTARELLARIGALLERSAMRREVENRLRESESRYRAIFEHPAQYTVVLQASQNGRGEIEDWIYLNANANAQRLLGIERKELLGARLSEVIPHEAQRLAQVCTETLHSGAPLQFESQVGDLTLLTTMFRMGENCVVAASIDVTTRTQLEEALRESEIRFRNMADSAPVMVWVTERDATCSFLSRSWCEFTGQALEKGLGFGWLQAVHPDDRSESERIFLEASARREPFRIEYRLRRHDGEYVYAIDAAAPRFSSSGEFLGYIGSVLDISHRRALELEREQLLEAERAARSAAEAANLLKDEFLATISHELRTPLSNVISWARVLERKYSGDDEHIKRGLSIIVNNAAAQAQLISDLLDMNRIASGKVSLELQPIELCELIEGVVTAHHPQAEAAGVTLQFTTADCPIEILADPARLQQIFNNLLSNALKFTSQGGRVEVIAADIESHGEIVIQDTGVGIAPDMLPHIFERFRQADSSTSRRYGGLGLGLAIVRQLTELHGGEVHASSDGVGQGARFSVRLPKVSNFEHAPNVAESVATTDLFEAEGLRGVRILAVEDDPGMLEYLDRTLQEQGAQVRAVRSAPAALAALRNETFHALVSDIGLPDVDGYELIRRVRSELKLPPTRLPAIAVTAFTRGEDQARALHAGFQAHLTKPFQVAQLVGLLRRYAVESPMDTAEQPQ